MPEQLSGTELQGSTWHLAIGTGQQNLIAGGQMPIANCQAQNQLNLRGEWTMAASVWSGYL